MEPLVNGAEEGGRTPASHRAENENGELIMEDLPEFLPGVVTGGPREKTLIGSRFSGEPRGWGYSPVSQLLQAGGEDEKTVTEDTEE